MVVFLTLCDTVNLKGFKQCQVIEVRITTDIFNIKA